MLVRLGERFSCEEVRVSGVQSIGAMGRSGSDNITGQLCVCDCAACMHSGMPPLQCSELLPL